MSSSGSHPHPHPPRQPTFNNKVFVKAQVDVNLSLGQLIRNMVFEEAESEYQQYAFFKTRFGKIGIAFVHKAFCCYWNLY